MARRIFSIILYAIGGLFLMGEALLAFLSGSTKIVMLAVYLPFILFFLVSGAVVARRNRQRELGIVLLAAAGASVIVIAAAVLLSTMPDTAFSIPPKSLAGFGDHLLGTANLLAMAGVGWAMLRQSRAGAR